MVDKKKTKDGGTEGSKDNRRTVVTAIVAAVAGALVAAACFAVPGMMNQQPQDAAAIVNGTVIKESDITENVAQLRQAVGAEDDDAWKKYLEEQGVTPAVVRLNFIQSKESEVVVEEVAAELGVTVTDEEVDAAVAEAKNDGVEGYGFSAYLRTIGETEEQYRNDARVMLLEEGIRAKLAVEYDVSEAADISSVFNKYMADKFAHIHLEMNEMPSGLPYDVK